MADEGTYPVLLWKTAWTASRKLLDAMPLARAPTTFLYVSKDVLTFLSLKTFKIRGQRATRRRAVLGPRNGYV